MLAIEYRKSVPRYLASRYLGPRFPSLYTSALGTIRLAKLPASPLPGPAWVHVRPRLSGICGSDLATLTAQGSTYFSPFTSCPFVLGHEVVGDVVECGPETRDLRVGDRVVLEPPLHCAVRGIAPPCAACSSGHPAHCLHVLQGDLAAGIQTGFCRSTGGGWSEGFVAHPLQLHRVPESVPDEIAVLVEPFACCLHAVVSSPVQDGDRVLVLGCGTIGLLTIAALRATGSRARILAVAKHDHQAKRAQSLGADEVIGTRDLREALASRLGASLHAPELGGPVALGGADLCFECVGSEASLDEALRFTRHHGSVILVGMPAIPRHVDWTPIWHKELVVRGAYTSTPPTFQRALAVVAGAGDLFTGIAGARFPLARYREAIDTALHAGRLGIVKTVFAP